MRCAAQTARGRDKGFIQALSLSGSLTQSSWSLRQSQARHASAERFRFWVLLLVTLRQGHPLDPPRKGKRLTHSSSDAREQDTALWSSSTGPPRALQARSPDPGSDTAHVRTQQLIRGCAGSLDRASAAFASKSSPLMLGAGGKPLRAAVPRFKTSVGHQPLNRMLCWFAAIGSLRQVHRCAGWAPSSNALSDGTISVLITCLLSSSPGCVCGEKHIHYGASYFGEAFPLPAYVCCWAGRGEGAGGLFSQYPAYPGISVRGGKVKEMLIKYPGVHSADICTSLLYGLSLALPKCTTIQRADFLSNRAAFIFPPHYPLPLEEK